VRYLLDTNICIYLIKRQPAVLVAKLTAQAVGDVGVSTITVAELEYGVEKSQQVERNRTALAQFLLPLAIVDFDDRSAAAYGQVRAALESAGTPIGALDTLIAAQALSLDAVLVTNNVREFSRVSRLKVENWVELQT
jgi:tRNA(fMet)-specific endonuclease VapC